jgi:hypothetical protein
MGVFIKKWSNKLLLDTPYTNFKKNVYGATGKYYWNKNEISFDDFKKLKKEIKIYDGRKIFKSEIEQNC